MSKQIQKPIQVFYSYSHKDEEMRDELEKHLILLRRNGLIANWHDRKITAGKEFDHEISRHLEDANVVLLLISADFLASDYCYDREMERALEKQRLGEARVIPIILRSCDWHSSAFGRLKAVPKDGKAVTLWENRDAAFTDIAVGIREVVQEIRSQPSARILNSGMEESIKFREGNAIVGFGIDLSGSMAESIRNDTNGQMSRLEGFGRALERLAKNARAGIKENRAKQILTAIDVFAYGFGIRGIGVCDLLSLLKVGREVLSEKEIDQIRKQYFKELDVRYKGYEGTKELLESLGVGSLAENLVRASGEEEIRKRVAVHLNERLVESIARIGETTLPLEELAEFWTNNQVVFKNAESLILGDSPMRSALLRIYSRFHAEFVRKTKKMDAILFLLSDGEPIPKDGDPLAVANSIIPSHQSCLTDRPA